MEREFDFKDTWENVKHRLRENASDNQERSMGRNGQLRFSAQEASNL
jgi:hypothetical protein